MRLALHAHHQAVFEGLDVDIGGLLTDRLGQQGVDQAHDRRIVLRFQQVGRLAQRTGGTGEVHLPQVAKGVHRLAGATLIGAGNELIEGVRSDLAQGESATDGAPRLTQCSRGQARTM